MTDEELLKEIERQRALMVAVATGGPRIQSVNQEYTERRAARIGAELAKRGLRDPGPYGDLWQWYGKWSSGDLPTYQSRRQYIAELYQPLIDRIISGPGAEGARVFPEPTGWAAIDPDIGQMRRLLEEAQSEVQYQAVGLFCRELLITLAQLVYDPGRHPTVDGMEPSSTDAKRMLEAYIAVELAGGSNEAARRHARAALGSGERSSAPENGDVPRGGALRRSHCGRCQSYRDYLRAARPSRGLRRWLGIDYGLAGLRGSSFLRTS